MGQPARRLGVPRRAQARRPARPQISDDGNGLPIHGNLRARAVRDRSGSNRGRLARRFDYGAHPDKLAAFPFPHTVDGRRAASTSAGSGSPPTSSRRLGPAVPISFCWHPYLQLPAAPARRLGAALAEVRARRGRRAHHPDRRAHAAAGRTRADRPPHVRRSLRARPRPHASRSRPPGARSHLTLRPATIRSAQLYVPPRGEFIAIEPMTATIDALGTGTTPMCRARRLGSARRSRSPAVRDAAAPAAAGRVHRVPRRPLRAGRSLLGESHAGRDRRHVVSRPRGLVTSARRGYRSRRVPEPRRDPLRRGAVHGTRVSASRIS